MLNHIVRVRLFHQYSSAFVGRGRTALRWSSSSSASSSKPEDNNSNKIASTAWKSQPTKGERDLRSIDVRPIQPSAPVGRLDRLAVTLRAAAGRSTVAARLTQRPLELIEWIQQPTQKKVDSAVRSGNRLLFTFLVVSIGHMIALYVIFRKHEITEREFFRFFPESLIQKVDDRIAEELLEKYDGKFRGSSDPVLKEMDSILHRLLKANKEVLREDERFEHSHNCILIEDDVPQAFAIYSHRFLVFSTGLMSALCENESQRAYVIANNLAHYILKHRREPAVDFSLGSLWTSLKLFYCLHIWRAFNWSRWFEDMEAFKKFNEADEEVAQFFYKKYRKLETSMIYGTEVENEADRIAMQLLSRACFDLREAQKFSQKCALARKSISEEKSNSKEPETMPKPNYLLKNRFDETKLSFFEKNLQRFLDFRLSCDCPQLK